MADPSQRPTPHPETRAITGGRKDQHGALAPLLWPSTTFETESAEDAARLAKSVDPDRFYSRHGNPGVRAFEQAVADLEGAEAARAYASGMGAVTGVILGICSAGDHIVAQHQLYSQTTQVLLGICPRFGIDVTLVDGTEPGAFAAAVRPGKTTLVLAETPANPRLDLVDLDEIGAIKGPVTCVDSTFATPLGQQPLAHGADLVLHSATKGIAGHNDASLGIVCGSQELIDWLWGFAIFQGANASPFDAMNGVRGLRTLGGPATASERDGSDAGRRARGLAPCRRRALPGPRVPSATRPGQAPVGAHGGGHQLRRGRWPRGRPARSSTRSSWRAWRPPSGGPETIVCHPASTTHQSLLPEELEAMGIGQGTIRMSVGLEHADDLADDLAQALETAVRTTS